VASDSCTISPRALNRRSSTTVKRSMVKKDGTWPSMRRAISSKLAEAVS